MKPRMTDVVLPPTFEQTASFTPGPWEEASTQICKSVEDRISETARRAADIMYESVMESTQDYLRENVNFNIRSQLDAGARECRFLRAEAAKREGVVSELLEALRNFTDGRDIAYTDALVIARDAIAKAGA